MLEPVVPRIQDWPIAKLSVRKEDIKEEIVEDVIENINRNHQRAGSLRETLAKTLYLERIRIKTEHWKVDPPDELNFLSFIKDKLLEADPALDDKEAAQAAEQMLLREIARRYTHEIVGNFDPKVYWFAQQTLPLIFARLLHAGAGKLKGFIRPETMLQDRLFITGPVEKIRRLATKATLILVPTHFSNLDSIMVGYGMDMIGLPAFQYGAGLNLFNNRFLAFLMGNLGAYRLDRRKKNAIYLETLKTYSRVTVMHGVHTLFFPGGTRSRSGAIETDLKLGLIGTVVEAQRMHYETHPYNVAPRIIIVPLTTSYHFVFEASSLIEEHLRRTGKEQFLAPDKRISVIRNMLKFFWQVISTDSEITLSLNEPMDIFGNPVDDDGMSIDKEGNPIDISRYFYTRGQIRPDYQREAEYTKLLGDVIVDRFHTGNTVYSSHLVAFVAFELLKKKFKREDIYTILRLEPEDREIPFDDFLFAIRRALDRLFALNNMGRLKLAPHIVHDADEIIAHGLRNVGIYHPNKPLLRLPNGNISSEDMKLLLFYHNRLTGYALEQYID
jgi:glycerol-3-phosphate O-acyltransferase